MRRYLKWLITRHWLLTLVMMALSALTFGLASYNLFFFFKANLELIAEHGAFVLFDGALEQFLYLCLHGFLSLAAYIIFKACEKTLVEHLLQE